MPDGLGIDFGSDSIKLAVVRTGRERPVLLAACKLDRPAAAAEAAEGELPAIPPEILAKIRSSRARRSGGLIGLTGRDLMMKFSSLPPVPPWKLRLLMEYEIRVNQATGLTDICSDWRLLNVPGKGLQGNLLALVAIARNSYVRAMLAQAAGAKLSPDAGCPSAVGLYNAWAATAPKAGKETVFLLDVGHRQIESVIVTGGELVLARSNPGGAEAFEKAIAQVLHVGRDRARAFKHERARIPSEVKPDAAREELLISTGLREAADNIANAVKSSIMFCRVQTKSPKLDVDRVVLSGGGAKMKGLREHLAAKLGKPVEVFDPAEGFDLRRLDDASARLFDDAAGEMTVAIGLAVAAARPDSWRLEMLPEEYVARKRFWSRTVWACAAAACLAASLAVGYVRASAELSEAASRNAEVEKTLADWRAAHAKYEAVARAQRESAATARLYAGRTRYGVAMIELLRLLRSATPDGVNVDALAEPETAPAGESPGMRLRIDGRLDKTRIQNPFETLNRYMLDLKAEPFVVEATVSTQESAIGRGGAPGAGGGDPNRLRFNIQLVLDPTRLGADGSTGPAAARPTTNPAADGRREAPAAEAGGDK